MILAEDSVGSKAVHTWEKLGKAPGLPQPPPLKSGLWPAPASSFSSRRQPPTPANCPHSPSAARPHMAAEALEGTPSHIRAPGLATCQRTFPACWVPALWWLQLGPGQSSPTPHGPLCLRPTLRIVLHDPVTWVSLASTHKRGLQTGRIRALSWAPTA